MTSLAMEIAQGGLSKIRPTYGYYRQPNGWITVSPATDMDELKYRRQGWEPMPQYGRFDMSSKYAADNPLEWLFQQGGAAELIEAQIVESGLYMNPPRVPTCGQPLTQYHKLHNPGCWRNAKPVEFPQLHRALQPFPCRFCGVEKPTAKARDQHEAVMHKEERGNIKLGETIAQGMQAGRPKAALPFICGFCESGFKSHIKLAQHVKETHAEDDDGGA